MKSLELNPVRHDIRLSVTNDDYEKDEDYRTASIRLCDGGEEASGAVTADDCDKISKWFSELGATIRSETQQLKEKGKKKHGKSKSKKAKK